MLLSLVLAAIVHDYRHPGLSNAFQIAADSDIAREFNEQHVLEMDSLNKSLNALRSGTFNIFQTFSKETLRNLCSEIINLVLATDMSRHFELLSAFKSKFASHSTHRNSRLVSVIEGGGKPMNSLSTLGTSTGSLTVASLRGNSFRRGARRFSHTNSTLDVRIEFDCLSQKDKGLVLQMALKVADIGHMAAQLQQHEEWSLRLQEEFLKQGDLEKQMGFPVSPLMDRDKPSVMNPSNQVTFTSVIAIPMLEAWKRAFPEGGGKLYSQALSNRLHWQSKVTNQQK